MTVRSRRYFTATLIGHTLDRVLYGFQTYAFGATVLLRAAASGAFAIGPVAPLAATTALGVATTGSFGIGQLTAAPTLRVAPTSGGACFTRQPANIPPIFAQACGP